VQVGPIFFVLLLSNMIAMVSHVCHSTLFAFEGSQTNELSPHNVIGRMYFYVRMIHAYMLGDVAYKVSFAGFFDACLPLYVSLVRESSSHH
jgi:hypothetical protein